MYGSRIFVMKHYEAMNEVEVDYAAWKKEEGKSIIYFPTQRFYIYVILEGLQTDFSMLISTH